jgi:hypothetical protein
MTVMTIFERIRFNLAVTYRKFSPQNYKKSIVYKNKYSKSDK